MTYIKVKVFNLRFKYGDLELSSRSGEQLAGRAQSYRLKRQGYK
jgi:hypothetical protein